MSDMGGMKDDRKTKKLEYGVKEAVEYEGLNTSKAERVVWDRSLYYTQGDMLSLG